MECHKIQELALIFDSLEAEYCNFSQHFDGISVEENELPGIPTELTKVIKGVLGTQSSRWIYKKVPALNHQCPADMIKTEAGYKAVKLILMRMPL